MSMTPSSLRAFLSTSKKALTSAIANRTPINIVIGNESADLDSITSSIAFAYLRSVSAASSKTSSPYIPLANIPAEDVSIRPELLALLPQANLEPHHLITLSDLPQGDIEAQLKPGLTNWLLVDHNALQGKLGKVYAGRVRGCIDHHVEENTVPANTGDEPRTITKAGSCTSLVINHFRDAWESLSKSSSASNTAQGQSDAAVGADDAAVRQIWDAQLGKLALASILIDTHNLEAKDKVTDHDQKAVKYLEAKIHVAPRQANFHREAFFNQLNTEKKNLDDLPLQAILRKDYKQWEERGRQLGVSSIVKPLSLLTLKADRKSFTDELDSFANERGLAVLALMTTSTSSEGQFQRELLLRILDPGAEGMIHKFEEIATADLKLQPSDAVNVQSSELPMKVWWVRDTDMSRKQTAPILREALKL